MKSSLIGTAGTLASVMLDAVDRVPAALAGLATAAWMIRQIVVSFREKK